MNVVGSNHLWCVFLRCNGRLRYSSQGRSSSARVRVVSRPRQLRDRHAAERALALLRRRFRIGARKGHAKALVISGNKDGSLKLTQSRVLSASGVVYTLIRIPLVVMIGFTGIVSTLRAPRGRRTRSASVSQALAEMSTPPMPPRQGGPERCPLLVTCDDQKMGQAIVERLAYCASESWHGSRAKFLADLDPDSQHDWVRSALDV